MPVTPKVLIAGSELTGSAATYYTAGANITTIIKNLTFTNKSAGALTVTLYLVPTGGTADDTNKILDVLPIAAKECYAAFELAGKVLEAGGTIQALASSAGEITINASGVEVVR